MKCAKCDKESTRRLTPDLDIHGIPVCDSKECEQSIRLDLLQRLWENDYTNTGIKDDDND